MQVWVLIGAILAIAFEANALYDSRDDVVEVSPKLFNGLRSDNLVPNRARKLHSRKDYQAQR